MTEKVMRRMTRRTKMTPRAEQNGRRTTRTRRTWRPRSRKQTTTTTDALPVPPRRRRRHTPADPLPVPPPLTCLVPGVEEPEDYGGKIKKTHFKKNELKNENMVFSE